MKIEITPDRDSGVNVELFKDEIIPKLEEWVYEWLDEDEELVIEVTLLGESYSKEESSGLPD